MYCFYAKSSTDECMCIMQLHNVLGDFSNLNREISFLSVALCTCERFKLDSYVWSCVCHSSLEAWQAWLSRRQHERGQRRDKAWRWLVPLCCMVPILSCSMAARVPGFNLQRSPTYRLVYMRASQGDGKKHELASLLIFWEIKAMIMWSVKVQLSAFTISWL